MAAISLSRDGLHSLDKKAPGRKTSKRFFRRNEMAAFEIGYPLAEGPKGGRKAALRMGGIKVDSGSGAGVSGAPNVLRS